MEFATANHYLGGCRVVGAQFVSPRIAFRSLLQKGEGNAGVISSSYVGIYMTDMPTLPTVEAKHHVLCTCESEGVVYLWV